MLEECLTVKELIDELKQLDQDSKIFAAKWYKKDNGEWVCSSIPVTRGIREAIDVDSNKTIYTIETQQVDIKTIMNDFMEGIDYE